MYAVIRLRGGINTRPEIKDTLKMLRLNRVNHCVVIPDTPEYKGMIQRAKDYIAWGKISPEYLALILRNRGELEGGLRLTDEYLARNTPYKTIEKLSEAVCEGKASLRDVPKLTPIFRLHPPRNGHRGTKKAVKEGGELGHHPSLDALLNKMR
jgi:large subunit ribosomal protein L30